MFHLIPFLVCILLFLPFYIKSGEAKLDVISEALPGLFFYVWISACIHIAAYVFLAIGSINEYRYKIKQRFSSIGKLDFKWLQYILVVNLIIWLFDAFVITSHLLGIELEAFVKIDQFMGYILSGFIYFLGYRALVKHEHSIKQKTGSELQLIKSSGAKKYERSGLTLLKAEEYKKELLDYMENENPHLNPEITLSDLSEALSIPNNHLSQVINQKFDKNFFDFVNGYRIEEAKEWLSDSERSKETMLMIAFESGFKSKSTFNNAFKKHEGITPSQYKKEHSISPSSSRSGS
ncbi:MAG: AraC family transcriptional regulator [Balneolaceae bacterium]|nr:AraC family transcriptional regulator [Balneolaceae bacterium]